MKVFPPFRLDADNQCRWRDGERVILTPKAFCILNYLADRARRLVSQGDFLEALAPDGKIMAEPEP